jgi:hypothetical protein
MSMRVTLAKRLGHLVLVMMLASTITQVCHGQPGSIEARGVWVEGSTILLLANVSPCHHDFYPPPGVAVLLLSTDGGRTWKKRGPGLAGYEFESLYERDGKVWIAGEHTCEGPSTDPFVFVPVGDNQWEFHRIDEGNEAIDHLGWTGNGELIAWITVIRLEDLERGSTYVHHSLDGGRTWKEIGLARKHKIDVDARFIKITAHMHPLWRVVNLAGKGVLIQHRDAVSSPWKTVSHFTSWRCTKKEARK